MVPLGCFHVLANVNSAVMNAGYMRLSKETLKSQTLSLVYICYHQMDNLLVIVMVSKPLVIRSPGVSVICFITL